MSTRSGRIRSSIAESSPSRTRKVASPPRSPARNRKSSAERNTVRQSPSRKSPSRKPVSKYPARKSPSRTVKEKEDSIPKSIPKSPAKRPAIISSNVEVKLEDFKSKFEIYRSTRSKRTEYLIKDKDISVKSQLVEQENVNGSETTDSNTDYSLRNRRSVENIVRRSSRLREFVDSVPDIRRSLSKSVSKSISKSVDTYSDDEISELAPFNEKSSSVTRKLSTPVPSSVSLAQFNNKLEFGGRVGSGLLLLIVPVITLTLLLVCSKSCSHNVLNSLPQYTTISSWFSKQSVYIVVGQFLLQACILAVPILGKKLTDDSGKRYCFNALFSSIITFSLLLALEHYTTFKSNVLLDSYLQLATTSYLIVVFLSILLYVKSFNIDKSKLNPYGNTGFTIYDFFVGREIHPQVRRFNIKLWTYRVCNISTLVLLILLIRQSFKCSEKFSITNYNDVLREVHWKPTILVFTTMQIIYCLYFIVAEYKVITTFYWQYEGLGYLQLTGSAFYPFYFTSISKYVVDSELSLRTNTLIAASVVFLVGFIIMYYSNNIKYEFRINPVQPSMASLDSMPTFHGKKLLVSKLWGSVRHPNYMGDILIHIALALPGLLSSRVLAAMPALLTIVVLSHRIWRDHSRCRRRYGAAWHRYCKRVPSVLLPKVL